jgi:hypothetical protein
MMLHLLLLAGQEYPLAQRQWWLCCAVHSCCPALQKLLAAEPQLALLHQHMTAECRKLPHCWIGTCCCCAPMKRCCQEAHWPMGVILTLLDMSHCHTTHPQHLGVAAQVAEQPT